MAKAYTHAIQLDDFRKAEFQSGFDISPDSLNDGEIMVKVDKVALTANSVSYVIGSQAGLMPWLDAFPAAAGQGHIPCWGFGDVLYSRHADIPEGERLYGFFPIGSHIICEPGKTHQRGFTDTKPCRQGLAPFYNEYSYVRRESGYAPEFEDNMMLFRPLFGTSYLLQSYCEDHDFYGADRVIVSSASAKTAMGFGHLLRKHHGEHCKVIGLTSKRNYDFVLGLNCYDEVLTYEQVEQLSTGGTAILFDIAGNQAVRESVHLHLGEAIAYSGQVGQTHWDANTRAPADQLPGAKTVFWSGPDQLMSLRERYGEREFMKRVQASMVEFMMAAFNWIEVIPAKGKEAVTTRVLSMLDGEVSAKQGVVLSL